MVEVEHSKYLNEDERIALATGLSRMGFPQSVVITIVTAASRLPAMSPSQLGRRR